MQVFNRIAAILLWLALLAGCALLAVTPMRSVQVLQTALADFMGTLTSWQEARPTNFLIGQIAFGVIALLLFGALLWLEFYTIRRRGVRIRTAEGGAAEIDTDSIGRRLAWHLDQLADIVNVVPLVKSRGGSVDVKLEIEAAPDVDIPMKTDEVVHAARDVIEETLGLKLGKLDVHMRCLPFEPDWST